MHLTSQNYSEVAVSVKIASDKIFAATEFTLGCQVHCWPPRDLTGHTVQIRTADGTVLHTAVLSAFNGRYNETPEISLIAPNSVGSCKWSAVLEGHGNAKLRPGAVAEPFTLEVLPHQISILVWGMKSAVIASEQFQVTVGIRCCCGCNLAQRRLAIHDDMGGLIEETTVPNEIWPGSEAVYFVDTSMRGPALAGRSAWEVRAVSSQEEVVHFSEPAKFAVSTVPSAECNVIVRALDSNGSAPLGRATVCMHPFRATSDETGVAKLRVPKGEYRLLVSAPSYVAVSRRVKITNDYSTCVKLIGDRIQNPYSDWVNTV
jgi:hypothetical protein